jgi:hypothetical protein
VRVPRKILARRTLCDGDEVLAGFGTYGASKRLGNGMGVWWMELAVAISRVPLIHGLHLTYGALPTDFNFVLGPRPTNEDIVHALSMAVTREKGASTVAERAYWNAIVSLFEAARLVGSNDLPDLSEPKFDVYVRNARLDVVNATTEVLRQVL